MAAAGVAGLLRAAFLSVGGAARRWGLLARPLAVPGRCGGAGAPRTQSASAPARSSSEDKVTVHFVNRDGETLTAKGKVGDSLLDVVIENNLDIDGFDFIHDRKRQRYRQTEKQAPRKEPDAGLNPGSPGSRPGLKAGAKPLSHPGIP